MHEEIPKKGFWLEPAVDKFRKADEFVLAVVANLPTEWGLTGKVPTDLNSARVDISDDTAISISVRSVRAESSERSRYLYIRLAVHFLGHQGINRQALKQLVNEMNQSSGGWSVSACESGGYLLGATNSLLVESKNLLDSASLAATMLEALQADVARLLSEMYDYHDDSDVTLSAASLNIVFRQLEHLYEASINPSTDEKVLTYSAESLFDGLPLLKTRYNTREHPRQGLGLVFETFISLSYETEVAMHLTELLNSTMPNQTSSRIFSPGPLDTGVWVVFAQENGERASIGLISYIPGFYRTELSNEEH